MTQEIEIEFKNMLNKEEYNQLLIHFQDYPLTQHIQTNYYFETKDFQLKQNQAALRIRQKNGMYQLTLKQPNPNGPGLLETHCTLTDEEANSWISGTIIPKAQIKEALGEMNIDMLSLHYGGELETERTELPYQETTIVLDKSYYNDLIDYELELEATEEGHGLKIFHSLLSAHQIPKRKTLNKIERFYQTIKL